MKYLSTLGRVSGNRKIFVVLERLESLRIFVHSLMNELPLDNVIAFVVMSRCCIPKKAFLVQKLESNLYKTKKRSPPLKAN